MAQKTAFHVVYGGSGTHFIHPGITPCLPALGMGASGSTRLWFPSVITPAHVAIPRHRYSMLGNRNRSSHSAVRSSRQPCTSGPELPASPRRRGGLWERLPWIRAWQRLGVQLWTAEAQASRLPRAHSWSARSPRREVGEGPGPRGRPPCCPAACRVRERPAGSRGRRAGAPSPAPANALPVAITLLALRAKVTRLGDATAPVKL